MGDLYLPYLFFVLSNVSAVEKAEYALIFYLLKADLELLDS